MIRKLTFLLILLVQAVPAQTFNEVARFGGEGSGPGMFSKPSAISVTVEGNVYIVDTGNNRVQIFDVRGRYIKEIGGFGFNPDQFDNPVDIWTRSLINIYVSDFANKRIQRYNRKMDFISSKTSPEEYDQEFQFYEVASCAVNSQYDLFLLDWGESKIVKFNRNDIPERSFGTYESGQGELEEPHQLDIQKGTRLLVTDISRRSLLVFDFFGNYITELKAPGFIAPKGLAVDSDERIFVADPSARKIFLIAEDLNNISEIKLILTFPLRRPRDIALWRKPGSALSQMMFIIDDNEIIIGKLTDE